MKSKLEFNKQCITELNDATMSTIDGGGTPTVTTTIVVGAPITIVAGAVGVIIYIFW